MSENEIKPVAWVERSENGHDRMWSHSLDAWANRPANPEPLYSQSAIDRLTAERDEAMADAERYRWLRDHAVIGFYGAPSWRVSVSFYAANGIAYTLDNSIDAARKATP